MYKARSFIPKLVLCAVLVAWNPAPVLAQVFSVPVQGSAGAVGAGVAAGGATSTLLTKSSGVDYATIWTTATYPATTTVSQLLYSSAANTIAGLVTANSSLLVTSGAGVPSLATDIPTAVTIGTAYIYRVSGTDVAVADGGTGASTAQAAIDALSAVSGATNEHVLTKDTATGNAIFKAAAGGAVSSVTAANTTLTISPTTGAVVAGINLANANTWTADQTISIAGTALLALTDTTGPRTYQVRTVGTTFSIQDGTAAITRMLITSAGRMSIGLSAGFLSTGVGLSVLGGDNGIAEQLMVDATTANITAADTFIDFQDNTAASIGSIAGTGSAGVIAYNTFTGSHYTQVEDADRALLKPGMLLEATGDPLVTFVEKIEADRLDDRGEIVKGRRFKANTPGHVVRSRIARTRGSKAAYGVWGGTDKEGRDLVLALGTGYCEIANTGANLAVGDYLISSNVPGALEQQLDDVQRNSTVAKAMRAIMWVVGETTRRVPCIYLGG